MDEGERNEEDVRDWVGLSRFSGENNTFVAWRSRRAQTASKRAIKSADICSVRGQEGEVR